MNIPQQIQEETQSIIALMIENSSQIESVFEAVWDGAPDEQEMASHWFCVGWAISMSTEGRQYQQRITELEAENARYRIAIDAAGRISQRGMEAEQRIAELERQLAQRTGRVHSANQQIDAMLQTPYTAALPGDDSRLWA